MVGISKIYFKLLAINLSTIKNQNTNKQHENVTKNIVQEKMKINSEKKDEIKKWQSSIENVENSIEDTENYKRQGTIITSKERSIVNEEK